VVAYVQYDQKYALFSEPAVPSNAWWFPAIEYDPASIEANQYDGKSVKIAVIDTGIKHAHPDLDNANFKESNCRDFMSLKWNASGELTNPDGELITDAGDKEYHGTHVAGIIAAQLNDKLTVGLAHKSELMNLRAFPDANEVILAVAIKYAADNGAKVINASWGSMVTSRNPKAGRALKEVIDYACSKGIIFVCAAGNDGADIINYVPAKFDNVIAVGSVESDGHAYKRAPSSNFGKNVIGAPGVGILSLDAYSDHAMRSLDGTSMSTAFVCGLISKMLDKASTHLSPSSSDNLTDTVRELIKTNPIQPDLYEKAIDLGLIDVKKTLNSIPAILSD